MNRLHAQHCSQFYHFPGKHLVSKQFLRDPPSLGEGGWG